MKKYLAEFLGTYILVFAGTGAIIVNQEIPGSVTHVGICMVWGIVVAAMIYTFGAVSGAHLNPAVSITFWLVKLFPINQLFPFIISQLAGAFAASITLHFLFPENEMLGSTQPSGIPIQSFIIEIILGFMLMITILFTAHGSKETGILAGLAIGGVVLLEALFAGPITGASMNPARSLAPAMISGHWENIWIYLSAPIIGMMIAGFIWKLMRQK